MSQLNVNVVAPLGYTGPDLPGDSNFVEIVDKNGNTAMEITETETTVINPLKVDLIHFHFSLLFLFLFSTNLIYQNLNYLL